MKRVLISMFVVLSLLLIVSCTATYTVSFDTTGGTPESIDSQAVSAGGIATKPKPDPTKDGYEFNNWYSDEGCTSLWNFADKVNKSMTLYAGWKTATVYYTVTFETYGGTAVSPQEVAEGKTVTKPSPNPTKEGYEFKNWYSDPACTTVWNFSSKVTSDMTLYAGWRVLPYYTVSFDTNGGSPVPEAQKVMEGKTVTKPAKSPAKDGYVFKGWYMDKEAVAYPYNFATEVYNNFTLYSGYDELVTITFYTLGGTPIPNFVTVKAGEKLPSVPANPTLKNYTFIGWVTQLADVDQEKYRVDLTSYKFTGDTDLYAWYEATPSVTMYVASFNLNASDASGKPGDQLLPINNATKTATAVDPCWRADSDGRRLIVVPERSGYVFAGWFYDASCVTPAFLTNGEQTVFDNTVFYAGWYDLDDVFEYDYSGKVITGFNDTAEAKGSWSKSLIKSLVIPEGVTAIDDSESDMLSGFTYLEDVVLPSTLVAIGDCGLAGASGLISVTDGAGTKGVIRRDVTIPARVKTIGANFIEGEFTSLCLAGVETITGYALSSLGPIEVEAPKATEIGCQDGFKGIVKAPLITSSRQIARVNSSDISSVGRTTVYVASTYTDDPIYPTYANVVRSSEKVTISVKTSEELNAALQIPGATIELAGGRYQLASWQPVKSNVTLKGSNVTILFNGEGNGLDLSDGNFFGIADGSTITLSDLDSGSLWYAMQTANAIIDLSNFAKPAAVDIKPGVGSGDPKKISFAKNVILTNSNTACDAKLNFTYNSSQEWFALDGAENITGKNGVKVIINRYADLSEFVKADGGYLLLGNELAGGYQKVDVTGKGVTLDFNGRGLGSGWTDYFKVSGKDFTFKTSANEFLNCASFDGVTIELIEDLTVSAGVFDQKTVDFSELKTGIKVKGNCSLNFGVGVNLDGFDKVTLVEVINDMTGEVVGYPVLRGENDTQLRELFKAVDAYVGIISGSNVTLNKDFNIPSGKTLVLDSDSTFVLGDRKLTASDSDSKIILEVSGKNASLAFAVKNASVYVDSSVSNIGSATILNSVYLPKSTGVYGVLTVAGGKVIGDGKTKINVSVTAYGDGFTALENVNLLGSVTVTDYNAGSVSAPEWKASNVTLKNCRASTVTIYGVYDKNSYVKLDGGLYGDEDLTNLVFIFPTYNSGKADVRLGSIEFVNTQIYSSAVNSSNDTVAKVLAKGNPHATNISYDAPIRGSGCDYLTTMGCTFTYLWTNTGKINGTVSCRYGWMEN